MKKKKTQASAFNKYLLIGLSVFCILMMTLSVVSEKTKGPFKMIAEVTVVPLQKGINHIGSWMGDMKDNFQTLKEVRAENKKLQEQVDSLVIENNNLQQERYELERLQELYQLDQSDENKLMKRIDETFPDKEFIKDVYEHLAYFFQVAVGSGMGQTFMFEIEKFCFTYKYFPTRVDSALRILGLRE